MWGHTKIFFKFPSLRKILSHCNEHQFWATKLPLLMTLSNLTQWDTGSRHLHFIGSPFQIKLWLYPLYTIQIQFSRGFQSTKDLNKFSLGREANYIPTELVFFLLNLLLLTQKFLHPWNTHWKRGLTHALVRQELIFYLGYLYWPVRQLLSNRTQIMIIFSSATVRYYNFCALAAFMALFWRPLTFLSSNYESSGSCIPRLF